jgi:fructosamine-3-kinase
VSGVGARVESALERALGRPVRIDRRVPLGGGDVSQVERLHTTQGPFVLKTDRYRLPGVFSAEAEGLSALRASGTSLRVPAVIACSDEEPAFLVLEDLGQGRAQPDDDERFGRGLAELHRRGSDRFGFERRTFCGTTPQPNGWAHRWVDFYRDARLGHQLDLARRTDRLSTSEGRALELLIERLDALIDEPAEGPALIHGDLWSGNLHVAVTGVPSLIDPSASFSHREAELGMMQLFGSFGPRVYEAYDEAFPLDAGWRERNPLYQLYHLLNHLNLFGEAYRAQVMATVRCFV